MSEKTKKYSMFKLREDNRARLDQAHINRLVESIKSRNLLDLRPIIVNEEMEVIDGQHRLMAAKILDVPIYYVVEKKIKPTDIIKMNVAKAWGMQDYLNFYCHHQYPEYLKLLKFMTTNKVNVKVALSISLGHFTDRHEKFRQGEFVFHQEALDDEMEVCWETINYIRKMNAYSTYTSSSRFWMGLLKLIRHRRFDKEKWMKNVKQHIDTFGARAKSDDYVTMFQKIYNWHNKDPINIEEIDE